jgi:hypothetical protein
VKRAPASALFNIGDIVINSYNKFRYRCILEYPIENRGLKHQVFVNLDRFPSATGLTTADVVDTVQPASFMMLQIPAARVHDQSSEKFLRWVPIAGEQIKLFDYIKGAGSEDVIVSNWDYDAEKRRLQLLLTGRGPRITRFDYALMGHITLLRKLNA